ncbi:MAG: cupredoxin domain-containing protein [Stellaceae bacterium]
MRRELRLKAHASRPTPQKWLKLAVYRLSRWSVEAAVLQFARRAATATANNGGASNVGLARCAPGGEPNGPIDVALDQCCALRKAVSSTLPVIFPLRRGSGVVIVRTSCNCIWTKPMSRLAAVSAVIFLAFVVPGFAASPQIQITLKDHKFQPAEVSIPAGVKVELVVTNAQKIVAEFESSSLHREKIVPAGGRISVFVGPLDPGRYEFFDDFHHATRGYLVAK